MTFKRYGITGKMKMILKADNSALRRKLDFGVIQSVFFCKFNNVNQRSGE